MIRTLGFKYNVLRSGAIFSRLIALSDASSDASAPTIRMNDSGPIKTSFLGTFLPNAKVDLLSDEVQPVIVIDGVEHPLGVFLVTTVSDSQGDTARSISIEAYDRGWRLESTKTETMIYFAAGTNYLEAVKGLLTAAGITSVIETPTAASLTEARQEWDVGTSYLTIVNQLLGEINYKEIWFNQDGVAILEPVKTPTAENITHTLDSEKVSSLLLPSLRRETDAFSAPNVFICVCSNPDKDVPLVATAVNDNPASPLSTVRRGRRICTVEYVDNIASQKELQAYADRQRDSSMIRGETLIAQTALLPGFGVDDVTALHFNDFSGICLERAWTMELCVGGTMSHTLEKVVYALE